MNVSTRHYRTTLRSVALVFSLGASLCGTKSLEAQAPTEPPPNAPSDILAAWKNQVLAQNAFDEAKLTWLCQVSVDAQEDKPEAISRYREAAAQGNASAENTGMDTRFDVPRVADNTVGDTGAVLIMQTLESIPEAAHKKFDTAIELVRTDNAVRDYLCGWVQQVGPPTYHPTYMIMHGMNAVVAGLTKKPLQEELLPVPDASGTWKTIGTNDLHCAFTETNAPPHDAQAADRYRTTIEQAIADTSAPTAPGSGTPTSSPSSSTSGNGATSDRQDQTYGPLTFNSEGADFYVLQDGNFAPASVVDGTIVIHLHRRSFQIGYNGEQLNVCLAQSPFPEVSADPSGYRASCLSGPFTGAREPNSDALLVYGGHTWSDGNTELSDATSMKATPMKGFRFAYQVNQLMFVEARDMTLDRFSGTLYGYIVVYKQHERSNRDIMPVHLIFE